MLSKHQHSEQRKPLDCRRQSDLWSDRCPLRCPGLHTPANTCGAESGRTAYLQSLSSGSAPQRGKYHHLYSKHSFKKKKEVKYFGQHIQHRNIFKSHHSSEHLRNTYFHNTQTIETYCLLNERRKKFYCENVFLKHLSTTFSERKSLRNIQVIAMNVQYASSEVAKSSGVYLFLSSVVYLMEILNSCCALHRNLVSSSFGW